MASSPSSMSGRRNRTGCMSGISHLFDFNQALAGRKLLTDKKYGAGNESQKSIWKGDAEDFTSNVSSVGKIEFSKSASESRRSIEVPIKTLVAEDISQELGRVDETRIRAPSVVARLMGLDALPCESDGQSKPRGESENSIQKVHSDRLQHGKSPTFGSARVSKTGGPPTRSVSDLSSCRRSSWDERTPTFESLSTRSHSDEQELKVALDHWRGRKPDNRAQTQTLDDLDVQLAAKQMLIKKKLSEAKLGLLAKDNEQQEKLYESREFMDAMDFLQANKDFFARFLEEPDSLFAKHLRSSEGKSTQGKLEQLGKHSKRYAAGAVEHGITAQSIEHPVLSRRYAAGAPEHGIAAQNKDPPELSRSARRTSERITQVDGKVSMDDPLQQEKLLKTHQKHSAGSKYLATNEECSQPPTRIVVLKPGPGKVRNLMPLPERSPRSSSEFFDAIEIIKEDTVDVLQDLRCKLQPESAKDPRKARTSVSAQLKIVRDPREIAREIARQVRENVMKDMKANIKREMNYEYTLDKNKVPGEVLNTESGGINTNIRAISVTKSRDTSSETISSFPSQSFDKKSLPRGKGDSKRSLEQIFFEKSVVRPLGLHGPASRRNPCFPDCELRHKYDGQLGVRRVCEVSSINTSRTRSASETDIDCDSDLHTQSVYESEADAYARNENAACITLLRSRSVPTRGSFYEKVEKNGSVQDHTLLACEPNPTDVKRLSDAVTHQTGPFKRSVFRRMRSGSKAVSAKGSTLALGQEETPTTTEKFGLNLCPRHDKVQHQIDDSGPLLDSDSSASQDDFVMLEPPSVKENVTDDKFTGKSTNFLTTTGNFATSKGECLSPEESPSKSSRSTDVEPMPADCDLSKDLLEQPSPVSVLDAPFHEEPASPMDFEEISSGLQELGVRLELLKLSDQDTLAVSSQDKYQEEKIKLRDDDQFATNHLQKVSKNKDDSNFYPNGILCPEENIQELTYVQKLLCASGFTANSATVLTRWHLPSQPLAASVFEGVENAYNDTITTECGLSFLTRHLLFDSVNEVLLQILGPYVNCRAWWKRSPRLSKMPLGEDLVRQVWTGIYHLLCLQSENEDTLGSLVGKDLATRDQWHDFSLGFESVIQGVEKVIWNDVLEETLVSYY